MCSECVEDQEAFRAYMQDHLFEVYAKPDLVTDHIDAEGAAHAIRWATANAGDYGYTDEQIANLDALHKKMDEANTPEEQAAAVSEITGYLAEMVAGRYAGVDISDDGFSIPTKASIADDQAAWEDEDLSARMTRAVQHSYFYHEGRPQYYARVYDDKFMTAVGTRMGTYARQAMATLPQFNTVLLVLQEEGAVDALVTIMMTVYLEGLMAGYYAGARATDCIMWQTHELGPVGRMDDRDDAIKIAETLKKFDEHEENK